MKVSEARYASVCEWIDSSVREERRRVEDKNAAEGKDIRLNEGESIHTGSR